MTEQTDLIQVVADWIDDFDGVAPINRRKQLLSARSLLAKLAEHNVYQRVESVEVRADEDGAMQEYQYYTFEPLLPEDK